MYFLNLGLIKQVRTAAFDWQINLLIHFLITPLKHKFISNVMHKSVITVASFLETTQLERSTFSPSEHPEMTYGQVPAYDRLHDKFMKVFLETS